MKNKQKRTHHPHERVPVGKLRLDIWYGPPAENSDGPSQWQWQTTDHNEHREVGDVLDASFNQPLRELCVNRFQLWSGLNLDNVPEPEEYDAPCWRHTREGETRALRIPPMFIDT
jgi:hypothetical protein